jgi:protein-S-isoprenylcysteine O-methyltransferase Ste14
MKQVIEFPVRIALLGCMCLIFWATASVALPKTVNLCVIFGGIWLTLPAAWVGRRILDRGHTPGHAVWATTFMHCAMGFTLGVPFFRAFVTYQDWRGWVLPVPPRVGSALVIITGAACAVTVANLALKGFGAPFFVVLSRKLAADWLYAWTRNPMVLAALSWFVSLGIWFRSALFVLWVLVVFTPALLFFVKVFEERELELRFGASYLEYKARTPMLIPRRPRRPGSAADAAAPVPPDA